MSRSRVFYGKKSFFIGMIVVGLMYSCETVQEKEAPQKAEQSQSDPFERLKELSKAALAVKVYSVVEQGATILPGASITLENLETRERVKPAISQKGYNVFLKITPGYYRLYSIFYEDPLAYPVVNLLFKTVNDREIGLPTPSDENSEYTILVKPRKFQYGGDYTIVLKKNKIRVSPPEFDNELKDMKVAADLLLTEKPHSRWALEAMKILELNENSGD